MRSVLFFLVIIISFNTSAVLAKSNVSLSKNYLEKKKKEGGFDKNRLFVGGGLGGGSFGQGFFASASPTVGYRFTDKLHVGTSLGLNYFSSKEQYSNINNGSAETFRRRGVHYTLNTFARYFVLNSLFLQVQPEYNNFKFYNSDPYNLTIDDVDLDTGKIKEDFSRLGVPSFLVGAGYAQLMGRGSYLMFSIMYDLVQNPNSPYFRQPVFGGGIALGLFGGR